jgi:hypothetical protein
MTSRSVTIASYGALALLLVLAGVVARARPDSLATVTAVTRRVCRTRPGELCLLLAWWWLGWHFLLGT